MEFKRKRQTDMKTLLSPKTVRLHTLDVMTMMRRRRRRETKLLHIGLCRFRFHFPLCYAPCSERKGESQKKQHIMAQPFSIYSTWLTIQKISNSIVLSDSIESTTISNGNKNRKRINEKSKLLD